MGGFKMEVEMNSKMTVTYLGTNSLVFRKSGSALLVDPHFTRPGLCQLFQGLSSDPVRVAQGMEKAQLTGLDAVLITHTHYDHVLDMPAVVREAGGRVFGSESARQILLGSGLPGETFHPVKTGAAYPVGDFCVRFHPARHIAFPPPLHWLLPESGEITTPLTPPAPFWAYRCGEVFAVQVDRVLIFGSAGFTPGAYNIPNVETVILGIGGLATKPGDYLQRLYRETVLASEAELVWLSHWDNFFTPLKNEVKYLGFSDRTVRRIKALGKEHGQSVEVLPFNQLVNV